MKRYFTSLMAIVVIVAMVVIAWAPVAKGGPPTPFDTCLDFCEDQAICECAKILGGSLRLTKCNVLAQCVDSCYWWGCGDHCECDVDPICALWEKDVPVQAFPPEPPFAQNCFPNG